MEATCWSDYLCPWCYLGQDRSALMASLGLEVVHLPYELHPEIPPDGLRIKPDGRLAATFARVAEGCAEVGLPWRAPERMPNTRRALETAEWVRQRHPASFDALHAGLFAAHFAEGRALDDPKVLDEIVASAGPPVDEVRRAVERGEASPLVEQAMALARERGVTSTPTWVLADGFTVPGALERATLERWVRKLVAKHQVG